MIADAKRRKMDIAWRGKSMLQAKIRDMDLKGLDRKDNVQKQSTSNEDSDDETPLIPMNNAREWTREEDDVLYQACKKHEKYKYGEDGFIGRVMDELKAGPAAGRTKYAVKNRIYGKQWRYPSKSEDDMSKKRNATQAGLQPGGRKKAVARVIPNEGHRELETAPRAEPKNGERASKITARERMTDINYDEQSDEGEVVAGRV